jgi:hypothetical protein
MTAHTRPVTSLLITGSVRFGGDSLTVELLPLVLSLEAVSTVDVTTSL